MWIAPQRYRVKRWIVPFLTVLVALAMAVTLAVRLRPGMARATALVVASIALAALIGFSRVYLQVHYLSDVSGGWALGASAYALCAAVALVATSVRQNERRGAGKHHA